MPRHAAVRAVRRAGSLRRASFRQRPPSPCTVCRQLGVRACWAGAPDGRRRWCRAVALSQAGAAHSSEVTRCKSERQVAEAAASHASWALRIRETTPARQTRASATRHPARRRALRPRREFSAAPGPPPPLPPAPQPPPCFAPRAPPVASTASGRTGGRRAPGPRALAACAHVHPFTESTASMESVMRPAQSRASAPLLSRSPCVQIIAGPLLLRPRTCWANGRVCARCRWHAARWYSRVGALRSGWPWLSAGDSTTWVLAERLRAARVGGLGARGWSSRGRGRRGGVCLTASRSLRLTFRCRSARRQAEGQRVAGGRMRPEAVTTRAKPETRKSAQARTQGTRREASETPWAMGGARTLGSLLGDPQPPPPRCLLCARCDL